MNLAETYLVLVAVLCVVAPLPARAFTNGTLIPPYICDLEDLAIGGPKSLGDVIPLLQEGDAQAAIAGYHHLYTNATGYAAQNLCTAHIANNAAFSFGDNDFIISTINTNQHLIGLIVWIQDFPPLDYWKSYGGYVGNDEDSEFNLDNSNNNNGEDDDDDDSDKHSENEWAGWNTSTVALPRRIGTFKKAGLNMIPYPYKCGQTIVHQTALDNDAAIKFQSDTIVWTAPKNIFGTFVEVRGVCVTDTGYGKFAVQIPTSGVATGSSYGVSAGTTSATDATAIWASGSVAATTSTTTVAYGVAPSTTTTTFAYGVSLSTTTTTSAAAAVASSTTKTTTATAGGPAANVPTVTSQKAGNLLSAGKTATAFGGVVVMLVVLLI
ncbi:hypothetical protein HK100_011902 [Physocladia obscura]|uniref:Uncharacterized protein n=1 Tax=Physocladia obscura TaxID=109957 RepID=A0AAD5T205_9FUNG|nr:hypothetical protein HK100_011902 [Physocladia obscura]